MKVYVKNRYKYDLTKVVIDKILSKLGITEKYEVEYMQGNGRSVIIEYGDQKIYVIVSGNDPSGRNSFLAQYIPTVLEQYLHDTCLKKSIHIYLLDVSGGAKTDYILDTYRVAKTLGINILNESDLKVGAILPYSTFREWKKAKVSRQNYNLSNNASYAIEDGDEYIVFGKLYGANGKDAAIIACQLAKIAEREGKKVRFVEVKDHGTESLAETDKYLLEYYKVEISEGAIVLSEKQKSDKSTCRKQDEFKFNLLEKFGSKKCCLCECDIETNIIASHIHRIVDIDNSGLTPEEKRKQAVDADNGFWLCANHDKMFEYGVISFDKNGNLIINSTLEQHQIDFINYITTITKIKDAYITPNLLVFLEIHNKRVNL